MEQNLKKYIKNFKLREKLLVRFAIGVTILGGIASAETELKEPSGIVLIYSGIYCAAASQEYKKKANELTNIINDEKSKQYVKKRENDIN